MPDYSSNLAQALLCFAQNDIDTAIVYWNKSADCLTNHKGPGWVFSWLKCAQYLPDFGEALAKSDIPIAPIVTTFDFYALPLEWMDSLTLCQLVAKDNPEFFDDILTHGFPEESFESTDITSENWRIFLDYLPLPLQKRVEAVNHRMANTPNTVWLQRCINMLVATGKPLDTLYSNPDLLTYVLDSASAHERLTLIDKAIQSQNAR